MDRKLLAKHINHKKKKTQNDNDKILVNDLLLKEKEHQKTWGI